MKKTTLTLAIGLLGVPLMLGSCSTGEEMSNFRVYKDSTGFNTASVAKGSDELAYYTGVILDNRTDGKVTINSSDFKAKVDGKEYNALYFVFEVAGEADTTGTNIRYVNKSGTTKDVEKSDTGSTIKQDRVDVAFKLDSGTYSSYEILYKGTALKVFGA